MVTAVTLTMVKIVSFNIHGWPCSNMVWPWLLTMNNHDRTMDDLGLSMVLTSGHLARVFMESSHVLFSRVKFKKENYAACSTNSCVFIPWVFTSHWAVLTPILWLMTEYIKQSNYICVCFVAFIGYVFTFILNNFCHFHV